MKQRHLILFGLLGLTGWTGEVHGAGAVGAEVPWVSYQAEAATTNGQKLSSRIQGEIANEAIGREAVKLASAGQFIEWRVVRPANGLVIRFCSPDAVEGGGAESALTLLVNGQVRQKVVFNSLHTWLYGKGTNPQGQKPSEGSAHNFFDEVHFLLPGAPLKAGDSIRLLKGPADPGEWVIIDQIDLEPVGSPATLPSGFLSIVDFGALADDGKDDSPALKACAERAKAEKKGVWIPAGTFHQSEAFTVDGVKVKGAGMWYTRLTALGLSAPKFFRGNVGVHLEGEGAEVSDLAVEGTLLSRGEIHQHGVTGNVQHFVLENLWVEHTGTGMWLGPCGNGVVKHCRMRNTYADGCNLNGNSHDVLLEHNHSRGNGDDGLALFSSTEKSGAQGTCKNLTFRRNTVEAQWWGNGFGIYGGDNILTEANFVQSANSGAGIFLSTGFSSWPSNGARVIANTIVDCGGHGFAQAWGALQVYVPGKAFEGLLIEDNTVIRATSAGIRLYGGASALEATISGNRVEAPGGDGIHLVDSLRGTLTLKGNVFTKLPPGKTKVLNQAAAAQLKVRGL